MILHFAGYSNTGKTTFIKKCLPEFNRLGFKTACIKHCHNGMEMGSLGKDSDEFQAAGCPRMMMVSPGQTVLIEQHQPDVAELIQSRFSDADIVIVEGFKQLNLGYKILFLRKGIAEDWVFPEHELLAVISDFPVRCGIPNLNIENVNEFIKLISMKMEKEKAMHLSVQVNGKNVPTNQFVETIISNVVTAMAHSLKLEDQDIHSIKIELEEKG
jgi:molybdopterin-guanine dinucleotide biosynthesis adapter protein